MELSKTECNYGLNCLYIFLLTTGIVIFICISYGVGVGVVYAIGNDINYALGLGILVGPLFTLLCILIICKIFSLCSGTNNSFTENSFTENSRIVQ